MSKRKIVKPDKRKIVTEPDGRTFVIEPDGSKRRLFPAKSAQKKA